MEEIRWYEKLNYTETKDIIKEKLQNMSRDFVAIGFYLKLIRDKSLLLEDGYKSIWEFAEDNYGIKRSTASRWMAMNDRFSKNGNTPILSEEYINFGKSQLQEMLYLDDKQMEEVKPDMTAKIHNEKTADAQEVIEYLTSVLRGESTAQEIVVEGTGDGCSEARTMEKAPSEKEKLKAAELLGKRYALFTDKVETDVDMDLTITIDYGEDDTG